MRPTKSTIATRRPAPIHQLIPGLVEPVAPSRGHFRCEVFPTFQAPIAGRIVGLGPQALDAVRPATGRAAKRHHDTAYAVSHAALRDRDGPRSGRRVTG